MYRTRKSQWQAHKKPKRVNDRTRTTAHQSKREVVEYEIQECIFALATEENCKILGGGMIKDRDENLNTTVFVRTISGKTISHQMRQKTKCNKNNGHSGKKDIGPERPGIPREPRKSVKRQETMEESNFEAGATIELSLRTKGGMREDEFREDEEYLRREVINAIKKIGRKDGKLLEKNGRTN